MTLWSTKLVHQIYWFFFRSIINLCLIFCLDPQIGLRYARPCALPPNTAVTSHIGVGYPPACAVPDKNTMTPQAGYVYPPPYPALTSYTDVGNPPHHPMAGKITLSSYDDTGYLPSHTAHGRTTMTSQDGSGHPPAYTDPGTTAVMSQNGNSSQHTVPAKAMVTYVGSEWCHDKLWMTQELTGHWQAWQTTGHDKHSKPVNLCKCKSGPRIILSHFLSLEFFFFTLLFPGMVINHISRFLHVTHYKIMLTFAPIGELIGSY